MSELKKYMLVQKGSYGDDCKEFNSEMEAMSEYYQVIKQHRYDYEGIEAEDEWEFRNKMYKIYYPNFIRGYKFTEQDGIHYVYVVKKPETLKEKLLMEITLAENGLDEYAYELSDTSCCWEHLNKLKDLIVDNL